MKNKRPLSLSRYINSLQAHGTYNFTRKQALSDLKLSSDAFKVAAWRLTKQGRIVSPRRSFFVIISLEYTSMGAPPPSWYIDNLMKFQNRPYYVGLLTAASLHGSAHQQPQEFQIVTEKPLRPIIVGRSRIKFFTKHKMNYAFTKDINTPTGIMKISSPELTALDLLRYMESVGHLNNIATLLKGLKEKLNATMLINTAEKELGNLQRLGYLLDRIYARKLSKPLSVWIKKMKPSYLPLRPDRPYGKNKKNNRWHLYINENIEVDE